MASKRRKKAKRGGATFQCPSCKNRTSVIITRRDPSGTVVRIRECERCHQRLDTAEKLVRKYDRPGAKKKSTRPSRVRELSLST